MPNNIEGRGLTDREMVQLCLDLEKNRCRSLCNTMLETAHKELREIYEQCFANASKNHFILFQLLSEKGWYKTEVATIDQISKIQDNMQNNLHPDDHFA